MSDTFTEKTEWITTHDELPEGYGRDVKNVASIVLGADLRLHVQNVTITHPNGKTISIVAKGTTVELFDSDGNHLATVASFASYTNQNIVTPVWDVLPSLITTVQSWPWTRDYIDNPPGSSSDAPFSGL